MQQTRIILFHKQATSARLRFLRFSYHSVCAFEPLPKLSVLLEDHEGEHSVMPHPAPMIQQVEERFGLNKGDLEAEAQYHASVDAAGGPVTVLLAGFTGIDPPFDLARDLQARFIDLTEARDLPSVELALLRRAYELILGG